MTHAWKQTIHINEEIASSLIQSQHHLLVDSIRLLDEGWDNIVYLVNRTLIFRFPRREFGLDCMDNEIGLLPYIKEHVSFALTAPKWVGFPSDLYPYAYAGYEMLPGLPLCDATNALIDNVDFARTLAMWLKELHAIPVSAAHIAMIKGDYEWKLDVIHRTSKCKENLERYEEYYSQAGFDKQALLNVIAQLAQLKCVPSKQAFVHGDLYSRHIIVDPISLMPTGLIDWGDVHVGHPGLDLASGMVFTNRALKIFLDVYGADEESRRIMAFHSFCHGMSFLPYAFEQDKDNLKRWASIVLARAMDEISKQDFLQHAK